MFAFSDSNPPFAPTYYKIAAAALDRALPKDEVAVLNVTKQDRERILHEICALILCRKDLGTNLYNPEFTDRIRKNLIDSLASVMIAPDTLGSADVEFYDRIAKDKVDTIQKSIDEQLQSNTQSVRKR